MTASNGQHRSLSISTPSFHYQTHELTSNLTERALASHHAAPRCRQWVAHSLSDTHTHNSSRCAQVTISYKHTHRHTDTHKQTHVYIYMTASNGQHRSLSIGILANSSPQGRNTGGVYLNTRGIAPLLLLAVCNM